MNRDAKGQRLIRVAWLFITNVVNTLYTLNIQNITMKVQSASDAVNKF